LANRLVDFYFGKKPDNRGRYLTTILGYSDLQLEKIHDFIQWLFPIETSSPVNPDAPVVDHITQSEFLKNSILRENLCKSCKRMLLFYGISCSHSKDATSVLSVNQDFSSKAVNWLQPNNHNHLRLTRILKSLRLLGLESCSASLYHFLEYLALEHPHRITRETVKYWQNTQTCRSPNKRFNTDAV
jgi:hypothetical protein